MKIKNNYKKLCTVQNTNKSDLYMPLNSKLFLVRVIHQDIYSYS